MNRFRPQSTRSVLWEVLAPYLRWPLYSPLRLAVVAVALVLAFATVARLHPPSSGTTTAMMTAPVSASPSVAAPSADAETPDPAPTFSFIPSPLAGAAAAPGPSVSVTPFVPRAVADNPTAVAEAFVTAWARRDAAIADWRRGVAAYATKAFTQRLASTDPRRVPATRRTGAASDVKVTGDTATAVVPTDGATLLVTLAKEQGHWRVGDLTPVSSAQAAPTPAMTPSAASTSSSATSSAATASASATASDSATR